jgi:hypothetical protein
MHEEVARENGNLDLLAWSLQRWVSVTVGKKVLTPRHSSSCAATRSWRDNVARAYQLSPWVRSMTGLAGSGCVHVLKASPSESHSAIQPHETGSCCTLVARLCNVAGGLQ